VVIKLTNKFVHVGFLGCRFCAYTESQVSLSPSQLWILPNSTLKQPTSCGNWLQWSSRHVILNVEKDDLVSRILCICAITVKSQTQLFLDNKRQIYFERKFVDLSSYFYHFFCKRVLRTHVSLFQQKTYMVSQHLIGQHANSFL